jgi:hypothetical protein
MDNDKSQLQMMKQEVLADAQRAMRRAKLPGAHEKHPVLGKTCMVTRPKTPRAVLARPQVTLRRTRWTPAANTIAKPAAPLRRL